MPRGPAGYLPDRSDPLACDYCDRTAPLTGTPDPGLQADRFVDAIRNGVGSIAHDPNHPTACPDCKERASWVRSIVVGFSAGMDTVSVQVSQIAEGLGQIVGLPW